VAIDWTTRIPVCKLVRVRLGTFVFSVEFTEVVQIDITVTIDIAVHALGIRYIDLVAARANLQSCEVLPVQVAIVQVAIPVELGRQRTVDRFARGTDPAQESSANLRAVALNGGQAESVQRCQCGDIADSQARG
jgi:hypothetical protein